MSSRSSPSPMESGSSPQSTLQSATTMNKVHVKTPEAPASLDDLVRSPQNSALRNHQPSSTLKGAFPDDPCRRSGFHLWRTESEDARQARLYRSIEDAQMQANSPGTWTDLLPNKVRGTAVWISSRCVLNLYRRSSIEFPEGTDDQVSHTDVALRHALAIREPKLTRLGLIVLTLSLAGAQLAWTLELAYGTPYLLSLGLSQQSTSLVWLAGPLSGLIAQPVVGSLSDHSTSSFRRRKYMIISASLLTLSTLTLAYSVPISIALVDLSGGGLGDWDPHRNELVHSTTQAISVIAFWILDFALNGLQAASRALILDTAPSEQQSIANAWQGRMTHTGNVVGYLCGWVDLASWKGLRWLGGGQFRRFAMISLLAMISCVSVTITFISESPAEHRFAHHHRQSMCTSTWHKVKDTLDDVWHAIRRLPRSVRRVCLVQLFAFMGWFPFLFYSTTYILQIAQYERNLKRQQKHEASTLGAFEETAHGLTGESGHTARPSSDRDAERGSFAMLLFAVVSLISAALLPYLALAGEKRGKIQLETQEPVAPTRPPRLGIPSDQESLHDCGNDPEHHEKISRAKRIARGLTQGLTLRTFWTLASIVFAVLMLVGTAWASTVSQATVVIALVGVPWSIAAWTPFAMVGEFVREAEDGASPFEFEDDHWSPQRTRARAEASWVRRQRRESVRASASRMNDDERVSKGGVVSPTRSASEARPGFKYIDPPQSPLHAQSRRWSHHRKGEQGARDGIRAALVDCAPLPHVLTRSSGSLEDDAFDPHSEGGAYTYAESSDGRANHTSGGAGTILGIHNLAIVAPQFVVAILASLIFSAVHQSQSGIHLVLGQQLPYLAPLALSVMGHSGDEEGRGVGSGGSGMVGNPAEGTIWVLRFGGAMAIFAALSTRFVPLTLSERRKRYGRQHSVHQQQYDDAEEEAVE